MSKQIKDYPKWVQEKAIERMREQGKTIDYQTQLGAAFLFLITRERSEPWFEVEKGNYKLLADFHGIKIDENGEEVREMPIISQDGEKVIPRNVADYYQELFNHMNDEYGLILTISEMDEIIRLSELVKTQTFKTK